MNALFTGFGTPGGVWTSLQAGAYGVTSWGVFSEFWQLTLNMDNGIVLQFAD